MAGRPKKRVEVDYAVLEHVQSPICNRICQLITKDNIDDFCKVIGVGKRAVQNWQKSKARPDIDRLGVIADYFGVTTDYLCGRVDESSPTIEDVEICERLGVSNDTLNTLMEIKDKDAFETLCNSPDFSMILTRFIWIREYSTKFVEIDKPLLIDDEEITENYKECDFQRYMITRDIEKISDLFDKRINQDDIKEDSSNGKRAKRTQKHT
jgi:transcriptional regulator with XRE-family HTH domain